MRSERRRQGSWKGGSKAPGRRLRAPENRPRSGAALVVLAVLSWAGPGSGQPAVDLPRHELILARHADAGRKDYDVWRMCGDGTQLASLVTGPGHQLQLTVSPDGDEFAYTSKAEGAGDVWRRPFGRGEPVNLTDHPADDSGPAWSPDGRLLAFFSDRDGGKPELYLLTLDGEAPVRRLTRNAFHDSGAAWSPDGKSIVFTRFFPSPDGKAAGAGEIVELALAAAAESQRTDLGGYSGNPTYSPDGRTIAFHRVHGERSEIWLMNADGSDPRAITDTFLDEYSPEWSPDGRWIAFSAGVGHDGLGTFDIWLMRPDGSGRRVLNAAPNTEAWQKWRPGNHYCR